MLIMLTQQPSLLQSLPAVSKPCNQIYVEQLLNEKRGYPLWVPQASTNTSREYQARGISIGDVGFFTESGEFDFLFNICLPADDPINPGQDEVPDGFQPISPEFSWRRQVREYTEALNDSSYLASSSISAQRTDTS